MAKKEYFYSISKDLKKLSLRALEVDGALPTAQIKKDINAVKKALKQRPDLAALCAPQIGIPSRIFCIRFSKGEIKAFVNPMVVKHEGAKFTIETNASIDGEYIVLRSERIRAIYQTDAGKIEENLFEGPVAAVFQQMNDMLDGLLISDYGLLVLPEFYEATDEERQELLTEYAKHLEAAGAAMAQAVKDDPLASGIQKVVDYMTAVTTGKVDEVPMDADGNLDFAHGSKAELAARDEFDRARAELLRKKLKLVDQGKKAEA